VAHAYRFGPPSHDVIVATFARTDGEVLARAFHFPRELRDQRDDLGLEARAERVSENAWRVFVSTKKIARAVSLAARGFVADDDFFDIEPGTTREIALVRALPNANEPEAIKPLNGLRTRIACKR
jgi:beta-mannosidase